MTLPARLAAPLEQIQFARLESYIWCSQHEMLHAGQIGLLRRRRRTPPRS